MRKVIAVTLSALGIIVWSATPATAATEDFVAGSGAVIFAGGSPGHVRVVGYGTTTDAHGRYKIHIPDHPLYQDVAGTIDCVNVVGNEAVVSGPVTSAASSDGYDYVIMGIRDNVVDEGSMDFVNPHLVRMSEQINCANTTAFASSPVERGYFTVRDR
ncbi:hypothetical protein ACLQ2Q_02975 [Microbacterium sp. DT81.1]|uniref:hypothetical protein n=1 Tax=Microbacterium sp. DT81.1 TaxID=3393413 RepID=UPI003CF59091